MVPPEPAEDGPWLTPAAGPEPSELAGRVAWWRAREEAFARRGPAQLRALLAAASPPRALPAGAHEALEGWLPWALLRRELQALLEAWFGPALRELGADVREGELARARSWLDARRRLRTLRAAEGPAALLAALGGSGAAWRLLCESHSPPAHGAALGRDAARLRELAARVAAGAGRVRGWDAGASSGEGTWELAAALLEGGAARVELVGSDVAPLVVEMARRQARPHDPEGGAALRAFLAARPALRDPARCQVGFQVHDLRAGPLAQELDLVVCHGVLGEGLSAPADLARALAALAGALRPGGLLSLTDHFRADRARAAREQVQALAPGVGLGDAGEGVWERR